MEAKRSRMRRLRMTKREGERSFGMTLEQPKFRLHMHFPSVSYVSPQLPADRAGIKPGWIVRSVGSRCVQGLSVTEVASLFRGVVEVDMEIEDMSYVESNDLPTTTTAPLEQPTARNSFDPFQARSAAVGATASVNASAIPFSTIPSRAISNAPVHVAANSAPISSSASSLPRYSTASMLASMVAQSGANTAAYTFGSQSTPTPLTVQPAQPMQAPASTKQIHTVTNQQAPQHPTTQPAPTVAQSTPAPKPAPAPAAQPTPVLKQPVPQHPMPAPEARSPQILKQSVPQCSATAEVSNAPQVVIQPVAQFPPVTTVVQSKATSKPSRITPQAAPQHPVAVPQPAATSKPATEPIKPQVVKPAPAQSNAQSKQPAPPQPKPRVVVQQQAPPSQKTVQHVNGLGASSHQVSQRPAHQSASHSSLAQRTAKEIGDKKLTVNGVKSPRAMVKQSAVATPQPAVTASPSRTAHSSFSSAESAIEHRSKKRSRRESVDSTTPRSQPKQARLRRNFIDDSSELEDVPDEEEFETRGRSRRSRRLASETGRQRQSLVVQRLITSGFTEEDAQASVDACGHDQEKCMIWIISLMEEREFTKQLNMASIESEQSKRNEEKELKKIESETLKKATAFASLFPTSFILQRDIGSSNFKTLVETTIGTVSGDCLMRVLFAKVLKLESQAIRWYKESAKCYMLQMAERLEGALGSHNVLSCCAEATTAGQCGFVKALQEEERLLTKTLFDMPENHGGVPLPFLQADEAMQFSLEDDGFEVIDHAEETLVD